MVGYLKTKRGYFYKLKKNGKKRISREKYNKKYKTRKNKKIIGGAEEPIEPIVPIEPIEPIVDSDIMYIDDLVCILRPDVKKGIIVWSNYTQPPGMDSLCNLGLKTGRQLQIEGVDFGRRVIHPYIFFRAPFYSRKIDYSTPENEIISSYGEDIGINPKVFIRVDPDRTFVFSSEIRTSSKWYGMVERFIYNSKKTLSRYLEIINNNMIIEKNVEPGKKIWYNLFTSEAVLFSDKANLEEPYNRVPINRNSEILVSIPHLTPDFFVLCTR